MLSNLLIRGVTKLAVPTFLDSSIQTAEIESQTVILLLVSGLEQIEQGLDLPIYLLLKKNFKCKIREKGD